MSAGLATPSVTTVLGPVSADRLGHVQPHEHLLADSSAQARALHAATDGQLGAAGIDPADRHLLMEDIRLENLHWIRRHARNVDNLRLTDVDVAVEELRAYAALGGGTIVECTSIGIGRDAAGLRRIAAASGVHVVMGCGHYLHDFHAPGLEALDEGAIAGQIVDDLTAGVRAGDETVVAGVIGEIGTSWPLHTVERTVLRAAAVAQRETGAGVQVHPGRDPRAPFAVLDVLAEAGADLARVSMSHVDRTLRRPADLLRLAATGCFVEFDFFGQESSYYPYAEFDLPNDARRADLLVELVAAGYTERLLISQDLGYKSLLSRYGGPGYGHILRDVVPLLRRKGLSADQVATITRVNPVRLLVDEG